MLESMEKQAKTITDLEMVVKEQGHKIEWWETRYYSGEHYDGWG